MDIQVKINEALPKDCIYFVSPQIAKALLNGNQYVLDKLVEMGEYKKCGIIEISGGREDD